MPGKLTIVIPALDEEQSIASIVERCLAQRDAIRSQCDLDEVEIVVVSDGSTDRTPQIAQTFEPQIRVVVFPVNRGYGAAIKEGWRLSGGDYLSFLDADGTCDPAYFVPMCKQAQTGTDVVLGNRLHEGSAMPGIRRLGNRLFALLLGYLSRESVGDTASGMRVIRRDALRFLYPLPDGLHFTPAMSAVCLVHENLTLAEIEMPYLERQGQSKLHVLKDGFRFLGTILAAVVLLRPGRITLPVIVVLVLGALAFAVEPVSFYLEHQLVGVASLQQLLVTTLLGILATTVFCATYLAEHVIAAGHLRLGGDLEGRGRIVSRGTFRVLVAATGLLGVAALVFAFPGPLGSGGPLGETHWSRLILAALVSTVFFQLFVTALLIRLVRALDTKLRAFHGGVISRS